MNTKRLTEVTVVKGDKVITFEGIAEAAQFLKVHKCYLYNAIKNNRTIRGEYQAFVSEDDGFNEDEQLLAFNKSWRNK